VTFFNIAPATHTWSVVQSQGFKSFATGSTLAIPTLSRGSGYNSNVIEVKSAADIPTTADGYPALAQAEVTLLLDHVKFGCICLLCAIHPGGAKDGKYYPFVFLPRKYGFVRIANLIYSRNLYQFVRFAGAIGRFLLRQHGLLFVKFNSDGPTRGIVGYHADNRPKFRKGNDDLIGAADIAYSEQVMFG
jgi:hypothetical protein